MKMMKTITILFTVLFFISCKSEKEKIPLSALDTGRDFIRASLNGEFNDAESLILKDDQNLQLFQSYKTFYDRLPAEKKQLYRNASYEINKYLDVDDSTTIINYSNSYMNKPMDIKLVRKNKTWLVDFKYTYSGNLPID